MRRTTRALAGALLAAGLGLSGCGGDDEADVDGGVTEQQVEDDDTDLEEDVPPGQTDDSSVDGEDDTPSTEEGM